MCKTKRCTKCGEEKPATLEYFGKNMSSKDKLICKCKSCYKKEYSLTDKGIASIAKRKIKEYLSGKGIRVCTKCGVEKYITKDFHKNKNSKDGYNYACKVCSNSFNKSYYHTPGVRLKTLERQKTYRNTPEVKKKRAEYMKEYHNRAHVKIMRERYRNTPEAKATRKAYSIRPEIKEMRRVYQYGLPDSVVSCEIRRGRNGLTKEDITPEMIETKRLTILLKRELNK